MAEIKQGRTEEVSGADTGSNRLCSVQVQIGMKHRDTKPLTGLGSGVVEVASRYDGDTYWAIYLVRFKAAEQHYRDVCAGG